MANVFAVLLIVALIALIVGLIKPSLFETKSNPKMSRLQIAIGGTVICLVLVVLIGVFAPDAPKSDDVPDGAVVVEADADTLSFVPTDYVIIEDEKKRDIKRVVKVELPHRISEAEIQGIANEIKNNDPNTYERTFILYFLAGEDKSAWASSHFDPSLIVKIMGSTVEDHEQLKNKTVSSTGRLVGEWSANWGYEYRQIIEEIEGKFYERQIFADSESQPTELTKTKIKGKDAFQSEAGKDHGEYYIINQNGDLEFWSENGNFYTAPKY